MSKERKRYTYRCDDCDYTYKFNHIQTYKKCHKCKDRGQLNLQSIEVTDDEVSFVEKAEIEHQKGWKS
mgnify:CR=1 FL=1